MPETPVTPDAAITRIETLVSNESKARSDDAKKIQDRLAEQDVRFERLEKRLTQNVSNPAAKFQFSPVIRGLVTGRWDGFEKVRDEGVEAFNTRDMSVASASGGGYITPAVYRPELIDLLTEKAQLTSMGVTTITGAKGKTITRPRKTTGTSAAYLAENIALGATAPVFDQVQVAPHLAGAYTAMSRLLAENADPSVEQIVRADLSRGAALLQDETGLYGSGAGSNPEGLFENSSVSVTQVLSAITLDKCLDAISAVEARNAIVDPTKAAFLMHPSLWGALRKAKGSTNDHYILSNDMSSPTRRSIQGYPVYVSTLMERTTGGTDSAFTMAFGDWSQLEHWVWNDVAIEATNVGGDAFVKHQVLVKIVWADDWFVTQPNSFQCYTDLYAS